MNRNFIFIIIINCVYIQRFERLESPGRRMRLEKGEANRTVLRANGTSASFDSYFKSFGGQVLGAGEQFEVVGFPRIRLPARTSQELSA